VKIIPHESLFVLTKDNNKELFIEILLIRIAIS